MKKKIKSKVTPSLKQQRHRICFTLAGMDKTLRKILIDPACGTATKFHLNYVIIDIANACRCLKEGI